jgi:hypothetical protein
MPMTDDQKTSLIGPSCEHMATEEEEKMEKMHSALVAPAHKDVSMALSVLVCYFK